MQRSLIFIASWLLIQAGALVALPVARSQRASTVGQSPTQTSALLPPLAAVRGLYLDATPMVSSAAVGPGKPFLLVLDVVPKNGIHVYAPGNRDYRPVGLTVDALPGVRIGPVQFPKAETFFFAPLKEQVHVYSQPFRLTRSVTLDSAKRATVPDGAAAMSLSGRLDYQACDEKVCYLPQTLSLTWSVPISR